MQFTDEDMKYLSGEKFSIWYKLKLSNNPLSSRIEFFWILQKINGFYISGVVIIFLISWIK
ncbi:hypothetical protein AGMMS49928_00130 [Spirochaetia bacterium]|nr:hypothetical protein AGMMS49928_00130 [Spirochaetia bacterium]